MNLKKLKEILLKNKPNYPINYTIPTILNTFDYNQGIYLNSNELLINPYDYLVTLLDKYFLKSYQPLETKSLSLLNDRQPQRNGGAWIKKSVVYSMLIRTSSAWDHDRDGNLSLNNMYNLRETGTFIKTIAILPYLKNIGVDAIYLLPISKYSRKNIKGDLGSPYSVANFFKLDQDLSDPMVEGDISLDDQFKLLVEAAHLLKIRVLIDIIPRTNAIENQLISANPDWFYWIKTKDLNKYKPPLVEELPGTTIPPIKKHMKTVFKNKNVINHISLFEHNPKQIDPIKWQQVLKEHETNPDILSIINKYYKLTIAPAFSDHINDNQPPWSDITFFRLYMDHPLYTKKYLKNPNVAPYILFDTIKANLYPGLKPNTKLWELISNVIPHYQKTYGIDGARIDMGHALPKTLIEMIVNKAKAIDKDFTFIAEELNPDNEKIAKRLKYNMIIGNSFSMLWDVKKLKTHEFVSAQVKRKIPSFAAAETHDTPRIAAREGKLVLSRFITILSMFIPNTVPFINSGQEIFEKQPINTGIDKRDIDLYMLDADDPYYMKLALFDKYAFHYTKYKNNVLLNDLSKIKKIRKKYLTAITNKSRYLPLKFLEGNHLIGFAYKTAKEILFIIGNPHYDYVQHSKIDLKPLREQFKLNNRATLLFATHEKQGRIIKEFDENGNLYFLLGKGEIKIFTMKKDG